MLDMELEHASGEMEGEVTSGRHAGRLLSDLGPAELSELLGECTRAGDQSASVLAAWLDRYHPEWRDDSRFAHGASAGQGDGGGAPAGGMTRDEAYEILGVTPEADEAEIRQAHKRLMKQFHPDQGGSDYLASKINEAKDLLLGKS
jgi:hypothetical protein